LGKVPNLNNFVFVQCLAASAESKKQYELL
jgi:hypothetical protein